MGSLRAALVLLLLAAAGCAAPPPSTPGPMEFQVPVPSCGVLCAVRTSDRPAAEPSAAINPTNPDEILVAAIESGLAIPQTAAAIQGPGWAFLTVRRSTDGGATWTRVPIPYLTTAAPGSGWNRFCVTADPVVFYDERGTAYLFGLGWPCTNAGRTPLGGTGSGAFSPATTSIGHVWMSRSTDGGAAWGDPVIVHESPGAIEWPDKEWAAVEPGTGRLLATWVGLSRDALRLRVSLSADRGATWSDAAVLTDSTQDGGASFFAPVPVFGADGRAHVLFRSCLGKCLKVATSSDGSKWDVVQAATLEHVKGDRGTQMGLPAIAFDALTRRLFVVYHGATAAGDADVFVAWSQDGRAWVSGIRVNDNPAGDDTDQYLPWVAAGGDGLVHVFYYDGREDPAREKLRASYARIEAASLAIVNAPAGPAWDPTPNDSNFVFFGDYEAAAAIKGKAVVAWTQQEPERGLRHIHASVFST